MGRKFKNEAWKRPYPIFFFHFLIGKSRSRGRKGICLRTCNEFVADPGWNQVQCPSYFLPLLAGESPYRAGAKSHCWGLIPHRYRERGCSGCGGSKTLTVPVTNGSISGTDRGPGTRVHFLVGYGLLGFELNWMQNQEQTRDGVGMEKGSGMHIPHYVSVR